MWKSSEHGGYLDEGSASMQVVWSFPFHNPMHVLILEVMNFRVVQLSKACNEKLVSLGMVQLSRQLQGLKLAFALFYLWIGICAAMASPWFGFELFMKLAFGDRLSDLHIATAVLPVLDIVTSTLKDNKNLPARALWLGFNLPCITMLFERKIFCTTGFVQSVRNYISQMGFIF